MTWTKKLKIFEREIIIHICNLITPQSNVLPKVLQFNFGSCFHNTSGKAFVRLLSKINILKKLNSLLHPRWCNGKILAAVRIQVLSWMCFRIFSLHKFNIFWRKYVYFLWCQHRMISFNYLTRAFDEIYYRILLGIRQFIGLYSPGSSRNAFLRLKRQWLIMKSAPNQNLL